MVMICAYSTFVVQALMHATYFLPRRLYVISLLPAHPRLAFLTSGLVGACVAPA